MSNNRARKNGNQKKSECTEHKDQDINRERFLTVLKDMTGQHVKVSLKDGSCFDAIFHTVSTVGDRDFTYVFKAAKSKTDRNHYSGYTTKVVKSDEVIQITIDSIVLKENQPGSGGEFATDGEISGNSAAHLMDRDLTEVNSAWLDKDLETDSDLAPPVKGEKWDQFQANFKLTGKMATFDENMYTTKLDVSKVNKEKTAAADALASEIENEAATGVSALHQATERGQQVDVGGLDEEDLFSGVARTETKAPPPATKTKFVFNPDAAAFTPTFKPSAPPAPPAVAPSTYTAPPPTGYYGGNAPYARGPQNRGGGYNNNFLPQQQQMYTFGPPGQMMMQPVVPVYMQPPMLEDYGHPVGGFDGGMPMTMGGAPHMGGPNKNKNKKKGGKGGTSINQQATDEVPPFVPDS